MLISVTKSLHWLAMRPKVIVRLKNRIRMSNCRRHGVEKNRLIDHGKGVGIE